MRTLLLSAAFTTVAFSSALAQSAPSASASNLPKACQEIAQGDQAQMMDRMQSQMTQMMQSGMQGMGQMSETQRALQQAMMKMQGPMMRGMMAKDADVAWICAMIPHHQGAIDMAKAGLLGAGDAESKKLAEETIRQNEKDLAKLTEWVDKHAGREMKNESVGTSPKK